MGVSHGTLLMLGFPDTDPSPHSCYSSLDFPQFLFDLENGKIVTDEYKKFAIGGRRMLKDLSRKWIEKTFCQDIIKQESM